MRLRNKEIRIENSNLCNAHCTICPREKLVRPLTTMPSDHFAFLSDQAKDLGAETISCFGYGEPLMDINLVEKIKYVKDIGLQSFVTTNGFLLDRSMSAALIYAGLNRIRFSVHGIASEKYNRIHKGMEFYRVISNIEQFRVIRDNMQKYCEIVLTVIPMHGETVDEILDYWGLVPDHIEIWKPHNWAGARKYRDGKSVKRTCGRPFNGPVQINSDGTMMVCCFDFNGEMTVGDTYSTTIGEILKGDDFQKIREAHTEGNFQGLPCESCDQLYDYEESPLLYSSLETGINKSFATKQELEGV